MGAIETHNVDVKGVTDLKVIVEDHPERRDKRAHFFRALNAFERQMPKPEHEQNEIIVDTRFMKIYAGSSHLSLGDATVAGWTWDVESCSKALADKIDVTRLKRDSLLDHR